MWRLSLLVSCLLLQNWAKAASLENKDTGVQKSPHQLYDLPNQSNAIVNNSVMKNGTTQFSAIAKGSFMKKGYSDAARMPGTNWCGKGWRADGFYKFGAYAGADRCCRQHDLGCHESINPGETKYGLTNVRFHAVMHCTCDERFRSCLRMAKTMSADVVGNMFFNVIKIPCFVFTRKKVCTRKTWWGKCLERGKEKRAIWKTSVTYDRM